MRGWTPRKTNVKREEEEGKKSALHDANNS